MWTFPGGVLEDVDGHTPDPLDEDTQHWGAPGLLMAAANAAVRETSEETSLECTLSALAWFSHWIPPKVGPPKRFATWFFVAPEHRGDIALDTSENDEFRWLSPSAALALSAEGEFPLAVPTWITLDDLCAFDSAATLLDNAVTQGARMFHTVALPADADGQRTLLWEGDVAYTNLDVDAPGPRNRVLANKSMQIVERLRS